MLTCKQLTRLASESIDRRLSFRERFSMRMHIMLCNMCNRYVEQTRKLHTIMRRKNELSTDTYMPELSTQARARILDKIQDKLRN